MAISWGNQKNSIAKNILHLFYSTALSSGLNAIALIVLAHYLEKYDYGMFSVVLAFAMIMGYFTDAGLSDIVIREGSKKEVDISILISSYVKMRLGLLFASFLFGFIIFHITHSGQRELIETANLLILPMVSGIALQSIGTTYFQLIEKMQYYGLIRIISSVCLVLTLLLGMLLHFKPLVICTLYGLSYFTAGIFGVYLVSKNVKIHLNSRFHKGLLQNLGSFTLGGLLFVLLPQLGPLVLENTISLKEVGVFAVAYRIPQALQQIPFIVAGAYYPVMFRSFNNNLLDDHLRYNMALLKIISLVGMAMTIPFYYMSEFIIHLLFSAKWNQAVYPLKILSVLLTLQAMNIALADGLTTRALQTYRTLVQFISVISGVFVYILLSKLYGVSGAAFAGVAIEAIAFLGFWICIPNRWIIAKKVILPYLSFFIICLGSIDFFLGAVPLLAMVIHFVLLTLMVFVDKEHWEKIKSYLKASGINQRWESKKSEGAKVNTKLTPKSERSSFTIFLLFLLVTLANYYIYVGFAIKPYMIFLILFLTVHIGSFYFHRLHLFEMAMLLFYMMYSFSGAFALYPASSIRIICGIILYIFCYFIMKAVIGNSRDSVIERAISDAGILFNIASLTLYFIGLKSLGFVFEGDRVYQFGVLLDRDYPRLIGLLQDPNFFVFYNTLFFPITFVILSR